MNNKQIIQAVVVLSALVTGQAAHAALVSCPASFVTDPTAKVENSTGTTTAASACQYLDNPDSSNVANLANINAAGFFGTTDWMVNSGNLQVNASASSGTWAITGADFAAYDYMIVFKNGNNTNLVGFLLNELYANGAWSTPFTSPPFNFNGNSRSHDVSHYTIVQREDDGEGPGNEIPEPGILGLLGIGLLGYSVTRRRPLKK
ncbi:PEP-CTERM sorting domain-containing protein [Massilia sp. UMI-21]|nr:PEP-CTERM sorting domain-containing protein [Massilia sp. UMI-21]